MKRSSGKWLTKLFAAVMTAALLSAQVVCPTAVYADEYTAETVEETEETDESETDKETVHEAAEDTYAVVTDGTAEESSETIVSAYDSESAAEADEIETETTVVMLVDNSDEDDETSDSVRVIPYESLEAVVDEEGNNVYADFDEVTYQKFATSEEGVYVYINADLSVFGGIVNLIFEISDEVEDYADVRIPISDAFWGAKGLSSYYLANMAPGSGVAINVQVMTADGNRHTYEYKDGSFYLSTPDLSDGEGLSDATGADGQQIPYAFVGALGKSQAILDLLNVKSLSGYTGLTKVYYIYDKLEEKGYTGDSALTDYLLDYYNNKKGTDYDSFSALVEDDPTVWSGMSSTANHQYNITSEQMEQLKKDYPDIYDALVNNDNIAVWPQRFGYAIQFKLPEEELAAISYNYFYDDLLNFSFGSDMSYKDWITWINKKDSTTLGVLDYMTNTDGVWDDANKFFNSLSAVGVSEDAAASIAFQAFLGINGPLTKNMYQYYKSGFGNEVLLEQVDGGISINKVDEDGELITSSETGFNLYYISVTDDNNETYYYALDEDGNGYFTADASLAAVLMTVEGKLDVQYLMPNTYYLLEVIAPDGYTLNTDALELLVEKGEITTADFVDVAIETETETEPETETKETESETETKETESETESKETESETETKETEEGTKETKDPKGRKETKKTEAQDSVQTGDQTNIFLWVCCLAASFAVLLMVSAIIIKSRKR